jgi:hypothetical protein
MTDPIPFNPLDKRNLALSVADALLAQPTHKLGSLKSFRGAGIYAIYYSGKFPPYSAITARNKGGKHEWPIYVGKAIPSGARKGNVGLSDNVGTVLFKRLQEHAETIRAAKNLDIADFDCRFLVVEDVWIPLTEALLIARLSPLWNKLLDGFGNHTPGAGRFAGMRPRWHVLHPGVDWAARCADRKETADQIAEEVANHLRTAPLPPPPKVTLI